jgi:[acyl-carrier-protein] S-malonyltransferase
VRWRQSLEALSGRGATVLAELGPGGVLTGMVRRTIPDVRGVAVAVPADLDKLMDTVAGTDEWTASSPAHQGEHLYTSERVIVSPAPGVFEPDVQLAALESIALAEATAAPGSGQGIDPGSILAVGDRVGTVGLTDVRTPFAGVLVRWLAVRGERVVEGQPVAWIRTPGGSS